MMYMYTWAGSLTSPLVVVVMSVFDKALNKVHVVYQKELECIL